MTTKVFERFPGTRSVEPLFEYVPGRRLPGQSFSRASSAHLSTQGETLKEVPSDVLRDGHWVENESGVLVRSTRLEAARTNELHNSDSPATQTRSLTAGTYTLWMDGTGSVNADGATDGDYGTATEGQANDVTFTVTTTQDVTFTVSGSVDRFQCGEGSFRSSFIETAGSSVSRAADSLSVPFPHSPQELTEYGKIRLEQDRDHRATIVDLGNFVDKVGLLLRVRGNQTDQWELTQKDSNDNIRVARLPMNATYGDVVEYRVVFESDGTFRLGISLEGGAESTNQNPNGVMPSSWGEDKIGVGRGLNSTFTIKSFASHISGPIIAPGVRTMDQMRSLVG